MSIFSSLFGRETLVGLDIGSSSLKAIQVEVQRGRFRIVRAAQQPTPTGAVRDGIVLNREGLTEAIQELLREADITATGAILAVSGPTVVVRQIRMAKVNEAILRKSIRYEASKYITSNIEDSAIAFEILGAVEEDPSQIEVMLVAAPREMVESRVAAVEAAGLDAVAVDIEAFAARRAMVEPNLDTFNDGALRALVDIGAAHTEVTILIGPDFALTRSIPIAGDTFTDALKNQLRLEAAEAEARKRELDMSVLVTGDMSIPGADLARILQMTVDELLREIRRSVNYYQSQQPEGAESAPLSEILLVGGSAQLRGVASYMTARLGTAVRLVDPFDCLMLEFTPEAEEWLREQGPQLGIALGLAIKEQMSAVGGKA